MTDVYVGLMSGTSMDGIDAAVVSFSDSRVNILATHAQPYPETLKKTLVKAIREPLDVALDASGELHRAVGECFRDGALTVIEKSGVERDDIRAIGSHGQTLRHQPDAIPPLSLQIGDAARIASGTGITTVANFRQADIDAGGQGVPLVPPFHQWLFGSTQDDRVVVNIGGIANITILPANGTDTVGFDTGPGNGLMDVWTSKHLNVAYDVNGNWAASGMPDRPLLEQMLLDPYFQRCPPKSTGFEYFNPDWLSQFALQQIDPAAVQATLCELTATTIATAISDYATATQQVFVCGGGVHNRALMDRLSHALPGTAVASTSSAGLDPDWVEAVAFAWLAKRTLHGQTGNLPSVTGASHKVVLGDIHSP